MSTFHIHPEISKASTIHTDFYLKPEHYEASREKIFARSWQWVGHTGLVPEAGDVCPVDLLPGYLDEPLLLTHDKTGEIRCLSNVCTHRGNLLVDKACKTPHLRCRYHGRQFGLDGSFMSMPEFREVRDFPSEADNLAQVTVMQWGPLLFVNLSRSTNPDPWFADMRQRLAWFPIDQLTLRSDLSKDYHVKAHWGLYCENYLEGFHIPFVHAGLNAVLDFGAYTTEIFDKSNLQLGIAKPGEACFDLPPGSPDYGKSVAAYYFWVFPNMMFNFYPWGLSLNVVEPTGIDSCRVRFLTYISDETRFGQGAGNALDTTEMEDEAVVEAVQRGIRSRFYHEGRFSVTREEGPHHFHRLVAEALN